MDYIAYVASLFGLIAFLKSVVPPEIWNTFNEFARSHLYVLNKYIKFDSCFYIYEYEDRFKRNELYHLVRWHLSSLSSTRATVAKLFSASDTAKIRCRLAEGEDLVEVFEGVAVRWEHRMIRRKDDDPELFFVLKMRTSDRQRLLQGFLSYVIAHGKEMERQSREKLLYTSDFNRSIPFNHAATFDTIALDPKQKRDIMADLQVFMDGEEFYKRVGKTWKRGYLLHGPPGTGKSSTIAAIANFTGYDVYDLDLTGVDNNNDLRELLMKTRNKSIIVIEDIDCSLDLSDRSKKDIAYRASQGLEGRKGLESNFKVEDMNSQVTLSGLLNFTDGIWSCCGSERIFIFTTNHIDKLDPALLRPGRMDMHILLSYCSFPAFKVTEQEKPHHRFGKRPRSFEVSQIQNTTAFGH